MKDLLTLSEVSTFLKVPKSTIYKLARERRLPGHKAWVQNAGSDEAMVGATSGNGSSDRFSLN
jgi:hypothetical protein